MVLALFKRLVRRKLPGEARTVQDGGGREGFQVVGAQGSCLIALTQNGCAWAVVNTVNEGTYR